MRIAQTCAVALAIGVAACAAALAAAMRPADARPGVPAGVPDLSGSWAHGALNGLELPLSGPGPVRNLVRERTGAQSGVGDRRQLVGDYANPILQPWAAQVVRRFGDMSLKGLGYPTPRNQCWPEQIPFVMANYGMQILQQPDRVTILYPYDHQFRQVRLDAAHQEPVKPSWYGDSVGRYQDGALLVDTVGIRVGPFSMIDWFGTPFTAAMHVVERYRLIDHEAAVAAIARDAKEHFQQDNPDNGPLVDRDDVGSALQVDITIEDTGAFTTAWSATLTLRRARAEALELVCAENPEWFPGTYSAVPRADRPDF